MPKSILTDAGVPNKQGRYIGPPAGTYAVWFDGVHRDGADPVPLRAGEKLPGVYQHDCMIELYEPKPDPTTEAAVEDQLDARGLDWTKSDRYWLQDQQRYQVVYDFSYFSKTR